jgi:hypothetical protein
MRFSVEIAAPQLRVPRDEFIKALTLRSVGDRIEIALAQRRVRGSSNFSGTP